MPLQGPRKEKAGSGPDSRGALPAPGFTPHIQDAEVAGEFTFRSFLFAGFLTIVFGAASGYLGLKIGVTFAASIPAAVMALAFLRGLFRNGHILEANMVQTQASAGEALMGGVVYMMPALIFLGFSPSALEFFLMGLAGGLLGIFLLIPLRYYLVISQHRILPFPEGSACADILHLGEKGGSQAGRVLWGMGLGAVYNLFTADGLKLFSGQLSLSFQKLWGLTVGINLTPLLLGAGFLVGPQVGATMLGGALLKGVVLIPALSWSHAQLANQPLSPERLEFLVRMIGAGAVATAGIVSLLRMGSQMWVSLRDGLQTWGRAAPERTLPRIHSNLPGKFVMAGLAAALALAASSLLLVASGEREAVSPGTVLLGLGLISVLGFLFVTLCARLVGYIGTSSYPLSGLTIGALLVTSVALRLWGLSGPAGMAAAIVIGSVLCVSIAVSADISQDLKTGALLGATPYRQQLGETVGILLSALVGAFILVLFHESGELQRVPAPQAHMMSTIIQGVMSDHFQWVFAGIGVLIACAAELLGLSAIMLAVGLYLPVPLASAWIVGGLLRGAFERRGGPETRRGSGVKARCWRPG